MAYVRRSELSGSLLSARVHCRHQLQANSIGDVRVGKRYGYAARFQRLTQGVEAGAAELRGRQDETYWTASSEGKRMFTEGPRAALISLAIRVGMVAWPSRR